MSVVLVLGLLSGTYAAGSLLHSGVRHWQAKKNNDLCRADELMNLIRGKCMAYLAMGFMASVSLTFLVNYGIPFNPCIVGIVIGTLNLMHYDYQKRKEEKDVERILRPR